MALEKPILTTGGGISDELSITNGNLISDDNNLWFKESSQSEAKSPEKTTTRRHPHQVY